MKFVLEVDMGDTAKTGRPPQNWGESCGIGPGTCTITN